MDTTSSSITFVGSIKENETIPDSVTDGIYFRMVAVALKKVQNSCWPTAGLCWSRWWHFSSDRKWQIPALSLTLVYPSGKKRKIESRPVVNNAKMKLRRQTTTKTLKKEKVLKRKWKNQKKKKPWEEEWVRRGIRDRAWNRLLHRPLQPLLDRWDRSGHPLLLLLLHDSRQRKESLLRRVVSWCSKDVCYPVVVCRHNPGFDALQERDTFHNEIRWINFITTTTEKWMKFDGFDLRGRCWRREKRRDCGWVSALVRRNWHLPVDQVR